MNHSVAKMYFMLKHPCDVLDLTTEQLRNVPKTALLHICGDYVHHVWDKLPAHLQEDPEVRTYRRCLEHYNQPWQRTHIDGPAPLIKDCGECQRLLQHHRK